MSVSLDIKELLDGLGTLGLLRVGVMDASPDAVGAIYDYGGLMVEGRFGVVGVGYERPSISITFRGVPNDYLNPMTKARIAWQALASVQPGALSPSNSVYHKIVPQQSPFSLGQDQNRRFEIVCNYYVTKEF